MNKPLTNILDIYRIAVQEHCNLDDAVKSFAKKKNIEYNEILSSCTRAMNINKDTFNNFLESDAFNFKNFLIRRFPEHQNQIIRFFNSYEDTSDIPILDFTKIIKPLSPLEKKSFNSHVIWSSLKENFEDWIARNDMPQDVKDELKGWIRKIEDHTI